MSKHKDAYDWQKDVVRIYQDPAEIKRRQLERRIVEYMLAPTDLVCAAKRMMEVGEKLQAKREENRAACDGVWKRLAEEIFQQKRINVFLMFVSYYVFWNLETEKPLGLTTLQEETHARIRFEIERYVGANIDTSMTYALELLEHYVRLTYGSTDPPQAGRGNLGFAAYQIIMMSFASPPTPHFPARKWLSNILAAQQTNAAAGNVWFYLMAMITAGNRNKLEVVIYEVTKMDRVDSAVMERAQERIMAALQQPIGAATLRMVAVSRAERRIFDDWVQRNDANNQPVLSKTAEVMEWYRLHADALLLDERAKCDDIKHRPRRVLLPDGQDHLEVRATPLYQAGLRSVIFYPQDFPNVDLELVIQLPSPHLVRVKATLNDFRLEMPRGVLAELGLYKEEELRALLQYVIIDVLYKIIAEPAGEKRPRKKQCGDRKTNDSERQRRIPVRPHIRRLPDGWKAGKESLELGVQRLGGLPDGFTFVGLYYRGGEIVHDLPSLPTVVYCDEDLYENVE